MCVFVYVICECVFVYVLSTYLKHFVYCPVMSALDAASNAAGGDCFDRLIFKLRSLPPARCRLWIPKKSMLAHTRGLACALVPAHAVGDSSSATAACTEAWTR
jgi:hypothetical protein